MQVRPFLMFQGDAEAAMQLYFATFPESAITEIARYKEGEAGRPGTIAKASFTIACQPLMCIDSPIAHAFTFTPAFSLFVDCDSEAELHRIHDALVVGGATLMPLGDQGVSSKSPPSAGPKRAESAS